VGFVRFFKVGFKKKQVGLFDWVKLHQPRPEKCTCDIAGTFRRSLTDSVPRALYLPYPSRCTPGLTQTKLYALV